jgi:phosphoribosyl 1,2-cyclic phosphate phosphodiesterase
MRVTLLGTGTSTGVPVIGCSCAVCSSDDPRDRRTRCSAYVRVRPGSSDELGILIDAGPDFREQALRHGIDRVDAVLVTHHHFDHVVGLDDLRPFLFYERAPIPLYARDNTAEVLRRMFSYIFQDGSYPGVPSLTLDEVEAPFTVSARVGEGEALVTPLPAHHGPLPLYGYRLGRFAYLTDVNEVPPSTEALLADLDVLVLDALRERPHHAHFSIDEAVAFAQRVGARQTYFIHMTHNLPHAVLDARLPDGIALGYDGLTFDVA